ncbi:MAG: site-specific DNA-methyltransferase [Planctomycetia bacterium]|nr:site-specific DNA-methyltransferase [Planctomycetia bacterium]
MSLPQLFYETTVGKIYWGDSLELLKDIPNNSVNLVMTSPPFGLVRKKEYGNVEADSYLQWFRDFAKEIHRILRENGSFVLDIGGSWNPGLPTRSLYHFKLVIMLCEEIGFHLAQDYYWWNPSKLPTPAEWVTVRRIRVKDAINTVWWLSKTPFPKASNKRVLHPYSGSMTELLKNGYRAKKRPSGHDISSKFSANNGGSIPPNLIAIPNTESNSSYIRYCTAEGIKPHPARFPRELPEYFIRMLTDSGDLVIDPFAGSCVTGEVCEKLNREWICCELVLDYLKGALGRFPVRPSEGKDEEVSYRVMKPGYHWNQRIEDKLSESGGATRE